MAPMVRHRLPVVMVVGNNGMWGLEKHPMQAIYGWDMACDLQPGCRYDEVVRALGGGGETVTDPSQIGPALDRAFASSVPAAIPTPEPEILLDAVANKMYGTELVAAGIY